MYCELLWQICVDIYFLARLGLGHRQPRQACSRSGSQRSACKSLQESLTRDVLAKISDKRLGTELASTGQSLWRGAKELVTDGSVSIRDERPLDHCTGLLRRVDTGAVLRDPLTKPMDPCKLLSALGSNCFNYCCVCCACALVDRPCLFELRV